MINFNLRSEEDRKTFDRINFMYFDYGNHVVRFLGDGVSKFVHWIPLSKATIQCLGDECPICQNNKKIYLEHPKDFRNVSGYISRQYRHYFNILDRTPVKVCPSCQNEVKKGIGNQFPPTCPKCNSFVLETKETISDKVKVANISDTNARNLASIQQSILDGEGNPKGLNNFDIMFMVVKGDKKSITPIPLPDRMDKVDIPEDALYDLETSVIKLESNEIVEHLKGVSLRDIFTSRKSDEAFMGESAKEVEVEEKLTEEEKSTIDDIEKITKELFGE